MMFVMVRHSLSHTHTHTGHLLPRFISLAMHYHKNNIFFLLVLLYCALFVRLRSMMKLGSSVEWKKALSEMTGGTGEMDGTALREYFRPLEDWLTADNAKHGEYVGWETGESLME